MALNAERGLAVAVLLALTASLVGVAICGYKLYRAHALNSLITQGEAAEIDSNAPPEGLFAKAYRLRQNGNLEAALKLYEQLAQIPNRKLQAKANYNIGNIYVARAQIEAQLHRFKYIGTLVGIARTQYQHALRLDSGFYGAKYNYEYTRFLVTERDSDEQNYKGGLGRRHEFTKDWAEFQEMPQGLP
jgi:tetratricopeptide (TPR) repeat protein